MTRPPYTPRPGLHPVTSAIRSQLSFYGVRARHNGGEISEAMVLGVGGGLGAGSILWGAPSHESLVLILNFRSNWQYPLRFVEPLCRRLGLDAEILETGSAKKAGAQLDSVLGEGRPATLWVEHARLPHWHLDHHECWTHGYAVNVFGRRGDGGTYLVDDKSRRPFEITTDRLREARAGIPSFKHRLLTLAPPAVVDLEPAVRQGLDACLEHLSARSDSFGLPAFRKWARMLTHRTSDKGWPKAFAEPTGLFQALSTIYEATAPVGGNGGNLRGLYADFLAEAREVTGVEELAEAEALYRRLDLRWRELGEAALAPEVAPFGEARELLDRRYAALTEDGGEAGDELRRLGEEAGRLWHRLYRDFPLPRERTEALLTALAERVEELYSAESEALEALRRGWGARG